MPTEVSDSMDDRAAADAVVRSLVDAGEFRVVFDAYFDVVFGYLARRVSRDDAAELTSETFLQAFRSRGRFDAKSGTVRAWVFGIAANLLRHHWRAEVRQLRAFARTGVDPLAVDADERAADERIDAQRQRQRLADALAALPRADREVLLLHAWAGLSNAEIATALAIPEGTVRSRLSRARKVVRERIELRGQVLNEITDLGS